jgi:hypothetical protein
MSADSRITVATEIHKQCTEKCLETDVNVRALETEKSWRFRYSKAHLETHKLTSDSSIRDGRIRHKQVP